MTSAVVVAGASGRAAIPPGLPRHSHFANRVRESLPRLVQGSSLAWISTEPNWPNIMLQFCPFDRITTGFRLLADMVL